MINRIDVNTEGTLLATASDDKTVRLWSLYEGGRLFRILHPFIGSSNEGKLFAVALSPNLSQGATAGWTKGDYLGFGKHNIYLFDIANAKITNRLTGLENTVLHLDFSPDSQYLVAALSNGQGIRVWHLSNLAEIMRDTDYAGDSYWVEFSPDSKHLVSSSYDGYIRLYNIQDTLQLKHKVKIAASPFSVRFSPDNEKIAIGFTGQARVAIVSAKDLTLLYWTVGTEKENGDLFITSWSPDGKYLYASGTYKKDNLLSIVRWDEMGKGLTPEIWPVAQNTVMGLHPLSEQLILYASSEPNWGILNSKGKHLINYPHETVYLNKNFPDDLLVSKDARVIQFEHDSIEGRIILRFSLTKQGMFKVITQPPDHLEISEIQYRLQERELFTGPIDNIMGSSTQEAIKKFQQRHGLSTSGQLDSATAVALLNEQTEVFPPTLTAPNLKIKSWKNSEHPQLNGNPLPLKENDFSISYAFSPRGDSLVLGTCFYLYHYDKAGNKLWEKNTPGITWAVNIAPDGETLIAAFSDGTLRWFKLENGNELLTLYPHPDQRRWIAWTATGIYSASAGADTLVGWHINNSPDQAASFFPISSLRERYYQPQTLAHILTQTDSSLSESEYIPELYRKEENTEAAESKFLGLPETFPPSVLLLTPHDGQTFSAPNLEIKVEYTLHFHDKISPTDVYLMVDGRLWQVTKNVGRNAEPEDTLKGHFTVTLPRRTVEISLIAKNEHGVSPPEIALLKWKGDACPVEQSNLYVLGIGVSEYVDKTLGYLPTPRKDAEMFVAKWSQQTEYFQEIKKRYLPDSSYSQIIDGLSWLREEAKPKDVIVIFLAGHALQHKDNLGNSYFFLPSDATPTSNTISSTVLLDVFKDIQSKIILFVDTAYFNVISRTHNTLSFADINGFANELYSPENGIIVFSSTTGTQHSQVGENGHSVFTTALMEVLDGKATFFTDKITLSEMGYYISNRVSELTGSQQTPMLAIPETIVSFPLGFNKKPVK